jgi:vacuolar-type H+-ATPase subunit F/Vma7
MTAPSTAVRTGREVAAVGETLVISGFRLAGIRLWPADEPADVRRAWSELGDVGLVILTAAAAEALGEERVVPGAPLTVVMPP